MMNYNEIATRANEYQQMRLAVAEQRRLEKVFPPRPHPLLAWVGQQLIGWGKQLQATKPTPVWPITVVGLARWGSKAVRQ